jgi:hypothetical protein
LTKGIVYLIFEVKNSCREVSAEMNEPRRKRTGYRPLMPEALTTFFLRRKRRGIRPVKEINL